MKYHTRHKLYYEWATLRALELKSANMRWQPLTMAQRHIMWLFDTEITATNSRWSFNLASYGVQAWAIGSITQLGVDTMQFDINSPAFKLMGMQYKSAYYDSKYWHDLCGVNPLDYPQFFNVTSHGKVYCTSLFNKCCKARSNAISDNWSALGIAH